MIEVEARPINYGTYLLNEAAPRQCVRFPKISASILRQFAIIWT